MKLNINLFYTFTIMINNFILNISENLLLCPKIVKVEAKVLFLNREKIALAVIQKKNDFKKAILFYVAFPIRWILSI